MSLENDISRLYVAKHFAPYVQLEQQEAQQSQSPFLTTLNKIIEKYGKQVGKKIKKYEQEVETLEESTEEQIAQSQIESVIIGFCTKAHKKLENELAKEYNKQREKLTSEEKQEYHKMMLELSSPEGVLMLASGLAKEEARQNLPPHEKEAQQRMQEIREQNDQKFEAYLASAGINTPEGKIAWTIAHHVGYHFSKIIYYEDDACKTAAGVSLDRINPQPVKVQPLELEKHILAAIIEGLNFDSVQELITNQNKESFYQKAIQWLSKEINERLSKGIEFNLFDAVSIKKLADGQIQLNLDKKEPC